MPRVSDARERLVTTTRKLLRRQGYHATGLNQIVDESDAPKGSLYHYFPGGKEALAVEAVQAASKELQATMRGAMEHSRTAGGFLKRLAEAMVQLLTTTSFEEACPISTVALETSTISPALQQACSTAFQTQRGIIEEGLIREGYNANQAKELALLAQSAWLGAVLLSRTEQSTALLESMIATLGKLLPEPQPHR